MQRSKRQRREERDFRKLQRLERERERLEYRLGTREPSQVTILKAGTPGQGDYIRAVRYNRVVFCLGPAGCGKTYIAAGLAAKALRNEMVERIVCVRPAVEAANSPGKNTLGYMPGGKDEKLSPYLRPLLTQLSKFFTEGELRRLRSGEVPIVELYPLEHLRGETFEDCFVILDEAQNATQEQLKMFLTRLGQNSFMIINGDITQSDLPSSLRGALEFYSNRLTIPPLDGVAVVELTNEDNMRDPLLQRMMERF